MAWLIKLFAAIAEAVVTVYFRELDLRKLAEREVKDVKDDVERARGFWDSVDRLRRLRSEQARHPGSDDPTSTVP